MRSSWTRVHLKSSDLCHWRQNKERHTHKHTGREYHVKTGRDWRDASTSLGIPRTTSNHQKLGDTQELFFPQSIQKEPTVLTPWFWVPSFQNSERIHFCCLRPPVCSSCYDSPWKQIHHLKSGTVPHLKHGNVHHCKAVPSLLLGSGDNGVSGHVISNDHAVRSC